MSRAVHRLFSSRSATRVSLNAAARSPRTALARRLMSSESHAHHEGAQGDKPWMIGSALVFGPLFLYLVSPSARKDSHVHTDHGHKSHNDHQDSRTQHVESNRKEHVEPIADDQGNEISGQEVKESMEKVFESDSPKDAQEREEVVAKAEATSVETSATDVDPQGGLLTDVTLIPGVELKVAAGTTVGVEEVINATSDEKAQSTANDASSLAVESKD